MNERTYVLFFLYLSHGSGSYLLLLFLGAFGWAMHRSGSARQQAIASGEIRKRKVASAIRCGSGALLTIDILLLGAAFVHLGCAATLKWETQCMGNMKQLSMALLVYASNYDDRLPATGKWAEAASADLQFNSDRDVFRCPAADSPAGYGMNSEMLRVNLSELESPAETVWLFETDAAIRSFVGGPENVATARHLGRSGIVYADGHFKWATEVKNLLWKPKELEKAPGERR